MDKAVMLLLLLAHFVTSVLLIDVMQIRVYPKHGSVYGVFHVSMPTGYAFNASVARGVCERLGVTIADKAQMKNALLHGFETCKFGWTDEQVAIIPRIHSKESCGKGKIGLIPWRANLNYTFDVFCFNSTDYDIQVNMEQETLSTTTVMMTQTLVMTLDDQDDPQSTSSRHPDSVDDAPESQRFSNTSPDNPAGLIALLTTVFAFLLLTVVAVCYFKKHSVGRWKKAQKESIQTEIYEKSGQESRADVSVTIKMENKNVNHNVLS